MLNDDRLSLRPPRFTEEELKFFLDIRNDAEIAHQLINRASPNTEAGIKDWLESKCNDPSIGYLFVIEAIIGGHGDAPSGYITYDIDDQISRVASLGICLAKSSRRTGQGLRSIRLLMNYLQNSLAVRKFIFKALASNSASRNLFSKLGFREIGILEKHFLSHKEFHDVIIGELVVGNLDP